MHLIIAVSSYNEPLKHSLGLITTWMETLIYYVFVVKFYSHDLETINL